MKPARVILLVFGSLIALIGFALGGAGASVGWAVGTQRDDAGFFTTSNQRFESDSFAITSDKIDLGDPGPHDWWAERDLATVRITADGAGSGDVFVGIGPEADVEAYLAGVPHDEISDLHYHPFSAEYRRQNTGGTAKPTPPADQTFWVAKASGASAQTVTWSLEPGRWAIVVMNADATPNVSADVELGGKVKYLVPLAIGLGIGGIVLLAIGAAMIVGGVVRAQPRTEPTENGHTGSLHPLPGVASLRPYPMRLEGELDPNLSRWQWLVKWFLAIPHFVVLVFLWIAFVVLTLVAFVAILFTGRYPRSIFDFNAGVLRWTWRVSFYCFGALGTDRYPPFTLHSADYPATLEITYPAQLSRGRVLIKSWLLAFPHLLILTALTATRTFGGDNGNGGFVLSGGLLGVLVIVAAFALLFTGRYPSGLYDFVLGVNRWTFRVIVYVALMTDEYPPFRLDQGAHEPITALFPPPSTPVGERALR